MAESLELRVIRTALLNDNYFNWQITNDKVCDNERDATRLQSHSECSQTSTKLIDNYLISRQAATITLTFIIYNLTMYNVQFMYYWIILQFTEFRGKPQR